MCSLHYTNICNTHISYITNLTTYKKYIRFLYNHHHIDIAGFVTMYAVQFVIEFVMEVLILNINIFIY